MTVMEQVALVLRWYQDEAVRATYNYFKSNKTGNPCVEIATGGGKTAVIATLCKDALGWNARVCVVAHVKELIEQAYNTLGKQLGGTDKVGMYSAGLNKRDTEQPIICAGIQSVYKRAAEFSASRNDIFEQHELKPFDLLIIDEAHLIPDDDNGMYRQFIADLLKINPKMRVIGLTATPYRLKSGLIYKHISNQANHSNLIFDACVYNTSIKLLITQGYLCPIKSYGGSVAADLSKVSIRAGDYVASEMSQAFEEVLLPALADATARCDRFMRKSVLVFAASKNIGKHIVEMLRKSGERVELITDDVSTEDRARYLQEFKDKQIRYLVNVNVLTTGFDAPNVDAVVLLRATKSPGLYYQMVGRGFRLHPDKSYCLVLDYGGNIARHGPVDDLKPPQLKRKGEGEAPIKECPDCHIFMHAALKFCPECNHEFTKESIDLLLEASRAGVISGEARTEDITIQHVSFYEHVKRGYENDPNVPTTMRVEYEASVTDRYKEWVCFEHDSYARQKAYAWWHERCPLVKCPESTAEAVALCNAGILPKTTKISVQHIAGERYDKIVGHEYGKPLTADEVEKVLSEVHAREEALNIEMMAETAAALLGSDWFNSDDIPF